jgi:hypothetical protein
MSVGTLGIMGTRPATVDDIHRLAAAMPGATLVEGSAGNAIYQVRRKSFIFFRNPRPDAADPDTGERYTDVIVFWVESEGDKRALVADTSTPFFTTSHFDGYPAVLIRGSRIGDLTADELAETVADAWLARAPKRLAADWLAAHPEWPSDA